MNIVEVPSAVRNFIKYFFSCRHCSDNFMNETKDLNQLDPNNKHDALLYLWRSKRACLSFSLRSVILTLSVHNHVNQRLQKDITEDPKHPKVLFPSADLCPTCQPTATSPEQQFDQSNTIQFLLQFYSKDNIDLSSVEESQIFELKGKASLDEYSMLELNHSASETSGFSSLIASVKRHFLLYTLAALVIIAVVLRRRHCKLKRKRYTL